MISAIVALCERQQPIEAHSVEWFSGSQYSPPEGVKVLAWVSNYPHPIVVHVAPGRWAWIWSGTNREAPHVLRWSWLPECPS